MPFRDDDVPRLPRGRGIKLAGPQIMRILMLAALLVVVIVLGKPCADSVSKFVVSFGTGSGTGTGTNTGTGKPADAGVKYIEITPDMTPEQIKKAIGGDRNQNQNQKETGRGTGTGTGTGTSAPQ